MIKPRAAAASLIAALAFALCGQPTLAATISPADAHRITIDAYVYGYPLVLMDVTARQATNVAKVLPNGLAPLNQFGSLRAFPTPQTRNVVSPNADTLYTIAFLDLSAGPLVLHVPDTHARYYLMPMLDAWTNVIASPGKRTTGTQASSFLIAGPHWSGKVRSGMREIKSPTALVWILGRIQTNGPTDYAAVHHLQDQFSLRHLEHARTSAMPASHPSSNVDMKTPPPQQVAHMDAQTFFTRLAQLMIKNPPSPADAPVLAEISKIGIVPGKPFHLKSLGHDVAASVAGAMADGRKKVAEGAKSGGSRLVSGWLANYTLGTYGTDYLKRAYTALVGLGANLAADAVYPRATTDVEGRALDGAHQYVAHFSLPPPVHAFWSLTMYDGENFFSPNALSRYALGDRDVLKHNADGSIDLYLQHSLPKGHESNWLPAPAGPFNVILRLYWPSENVLSGSWKLPAIRRLR